MNGQKATVMTTDRPTNAREVVGSDLDLITDQLKAELPQLAGRSLVIAGGAGSWATTSCRPRSTGTAGGSGAAHQAHRLDNFIRGVPTG
jgi:hypothetical protein